MARSWSSHEEKVGKHDLSVGRDLNGARPL